MLKIFTILSIFISLSYVTSAQTTDEDAIFIKKIHDQILINSKCHEWLRELCEKAPVRIAGSKAYQNAVEYTSKKLLEIGFDTVFLQPVKVQYWSRGDLETARLSWRADDKNFMDIPLEILSLGNSIGTGPDGVKGEIIEVKSLDEVDTLGSAVKGKVVFFNRPMDASQVNTFKAYGSAVDQRVYGASKAAEYGAVAVIVRSITLALDDFPHTGTLVYKDGIKKIPAVAVSTNHANFISSLIARGVNPSIYIENHCRFEGERVDYNVIAEIKGSEKPEEIILVSGHLDAWDVGEGAHDDGAGCVQAMEVLHTLKSLNYRPKRTLRCVLFANEENGLAGGREYARQAKENNEFHLLAIESDAGGFSPRGFSFDAHPDVIISQYRSVCRFLPLFESYGIFFETGGSGADINPLKDMKGLLCGLRPESQRYFDYHHTANDTFDKVHKRELELGAAAMTSLVYIVDKYGL